MKEQINRILAKHTYTLCIGNYHSVQGTVPASEELEQLMCYREVKAVIDWVDGKWWSNEFTELLVQQLSTSYSNEDVIKAIEQYKKKHQ